MPIEPTGSRLDSQQQQSIEEKFYAGNQGGDFTVNRKMVFGVAIAVLIIFFCLGMPIVWIPAALIVVFFIVMTVKDPKCSFNGFGDLEGAEDADSLFNQFSLLRTPMDAKADSAEAIVLYDKFIDVLVKGGVIDAKTELDDIEIAVINIDPPTYEVELHQIGKSQKTLRNACEGALAFYAAYLVSVDSLSPTRYRITYKQDSDIDTLANLGIVTYESLLREVEADYHD